MALLVLVFVLPASLALSSPPTTAAAPTSAAPQSFTQALKEALSHRSYVLLVLGYFTCGFQLAFITVHMPAYLVDRGLSAEVGGWTIAVIGAVQHRRLALFRLAHQPQAESD